MGFGTSECTLAHTSTSSSSPCGPNSSLTARPGTGFGTNGPSYSSTLSGTATSSLDGTLVECFGQANNMDLDIRVNGSTLQILDVYISKLIQSTVLQPVTVNELLCMYVSTVEPLLMDTPKKRTLMIQF